MKINIERQGDVVVVRPTGRFDNLHSTTISAACYRLIDEGMINIVIDLSQIEFLDSAGMAVLVSVLKRVRRLGGDARLVNPNASPVLRTLQLTKFDRVFDMTASVSDALGRFAHA